MYIENIHMLANHSIKVSTGLRICTRTYSQKIAPKNATNKAKKLQLASKMTSKKNDKKRSPLNPTPFHYGKYGGLKENEDEVIEKTTKMVQKIADFEQLRILPEVRDVVKTIISQESILNNRNFIASNRHETRLEHQKEKRGLELDTLKPSPIQIASVKKLSKGLMDPKLQIHTIAAETGSGKTMAYLIPLLDFLKRQEVESPENWEIMKNKAIIRSVILVPTHELVDQIYKTVLQAESLLKVNTFKWDTGSSYQGLVEKLKNRIDILVTTPGKLLSLFNIRMLNRPDRMLSQVKFVVLDEADTLMDQSWAEDTYKTIKTMPNASHLLFCSATIPNEFNKTMERLFPTAQTITTPRLHRLPHTIDFKTIDAALNPYKGSKIKALAQALYAIAKDGTEPGYEKRCIVFVNEKKEVAKVVEKLAGQYGHDCVGLTGDDSVEQRLAKISAFINPPRRLEEIEDESLKLHDDTQELQKISIPGSNIVIQSSQQAGQQKRPNSLKIVVTTDLMARGLNFQGVRNVILYDVPKTSIDLVHRAGRTGRMRQSGRVFMITDKSTKSWAKAIPKIVKNNIPLS